MPLLPFVGEDMHGSWEDAVLRPVKYFSKRTLPGLSASVHKLLFLSHTLAHPEQTQIA